MAGLIPVGSVIDPSRDVFPTTGAHLDVRVIPQFGAQKGRKINPETARSLLQNILIGKDRVPLVQRQGEDWRWNFPITSRFGPRSAPTRGASTFHRGIDVSLGVGTPLTYKGYGTYRPDHGFGSLMTSDSQGNPYEIRFLHTEPGKQASVGSSRVPEAPVLPGATAQSSNQNVNEKRNDKLMEELLGEQQSLRDVLMSSTIRKAMQQRQSSLLDDLPSLQAQTFTPEQAMALFS